MLYNMMNVHEMNCVHGFTLIEVMIVIVIIALMAAFAAPGFRERTVKAQVGGAVTELQAALAMARSEALTNGKAAVLISSGGSDFLAGWEIKVPIRGGNSSDPEFTAASFLPPKGLSEFTLYNSVDNQVKFFGDGRLDLRSDAYFCIKADSTANTEERKVLLTQAGQAMVLNGSCGNP